MIYLDLPNISNSGTVEQQLAEIRSYIYRNNEQMNATLSNLTVDKIWEQTASAISASNGDNEENVDILSNYQKIRDLIIKTADVIIQTDEQWKMAMNGSYLAKSQFGKYLLNTSVEIDGKSTGFTQLYTYSTGLGSDYGNYKSYQQNFIKEGLLDDTGATPIYGIDVGLLTSEFTVEKEDGTTEIVSVDSNKRLRITPVKLSLYDGNNEVAYIKESEIYFPKANINGGSINIGNGNFKVTSTGVMTAKKGTFSGSLSVDSLTASWNKWSNGGIKLENSQINSYYGGEQIFSISPNKFSFYKLYSDGSSLEMANIQRLSYGNHTGLGIKLEFPLGAFFTISKDSDTTLGYTPLLTYSRGQMSPYVSGDNIYGAEGLHIETPCYFHNTALLNANLKEVNIDSATSGGYTTKSGTTNILVRNSEGSEFWTTLTIKNGLIVGIHDGAFT